MGFYGAERPHSVLGPGVPDLPGYRVLSLKTRPTNVNPGSFGVIGHGWLVDRLMIMRCFNSSTQPLTTIMSVSGGWLTRSSARTSAKR